jgi:hypothetical protein
MEVSSNERGCSGLWQMNEADGVRYRNEGDRAKLLGR